MSFLERKGITEVDPRITHRHSPESSDFCWCLAGLLAFHITDAFPSDAFPSLPSAPGREVGGEVTVARVSVT